MKDLFIISHTHWDREWYRTREQYRLQLLPMMDRLLDLLERSPEFRSFLLDGQTVMVDDYLALRPERRDQLRRLVGEGRLQIGPWYVQPDEFLVSGEALFRNLLLGVQTAEALGGVTRVGWLPDTFGHVAQLPQILRNFAVNTAIVSRGLGDQALTCPSLFWWAAPDGSRVLALHQVGGYWNAGNLGHLSFWDHTSGRAPDVERARQTLLGLLPALDPEGVLPAVAVWNGADHNPPQSDLPQLIEALGGQVGGYRLRHGSLAEYVLGLSPDALPLTTVAGELRESRYQAVLPGTLSTRVYLKQANDRAQNLLQWTAEPLSALDWLLGGLYPQAELRQAWRLLLQNHAHDSLCGCSVEAVHREMTVRFDRVEQIGQASANRALEALARRVDTAWCGPGRLPILLFNPLARHRQQAAESTLRLPHCPPAFRATDLGEVRCRCRCWLANAKCTTGSPSRPRRVRLLSGWLSGERTCATYGVSTLPATNGPRPV